MSYSPAVGLRGIILIVQHTVEKTNPNMISLARVGSQTFAHLDVSFPVHAQLTQLTSLNFSGLPVYFSLHKRAGCTWCVDAWYSVEWYMQVSIGARRRRCLSGEAYAFGLP
jgi:hypothetical protein